MQHDMKPVHMKLAIVTSISLLVCTEGGREGGPHVQGSKDIGIKYNKI